jgi:hypothetical protein
MMPNTKYAALFGLLLCGLLLGPFGLGQSRPDEPPDLGLIDGYLVRVGTGEPLKGGQVVLRPERGRSPTFGAVTDASGHFTLESIQPGNYRLYVERDGYVDQQYGQVSPSRPGTVLVLAPGQQVEDLVISLVPTGTIAGRVFDEDGEPVVHANVRALRYVYQDGEKILTEVQQIQTNDLGEYRLFWLDPGEYFVSATFEARFGGGGRGLGGRGGVGGRGRRGGRGGPDGGGAVPGLAEPPVEEIYVDTYYPGTIQPSLATGVVLLGGAEVPAIDFVVLPTRAVAVRGRVVSPFAGEGAPVPIVTIVARNGVSSGNRFNLRGGGRANRGGQNQAGSFELTGVAPGSYTIVAIVRTQQGRGGRGGQGQLVGVTDIEVGEQDLNDVLVAVQPGVELTGRVLVDQSASGLETGRLRIRLQPANDMPFNAPNTRIEDDGTFLLSNVSQASYETSLTGLPPDYYVAEVRFGAADVLSSGLLVTADPPGPLEFLISGAGGRVDGAVQIGTEESFTGAQVVLVPAADRGRSDLYKTASADQYGRFSIVGIAPGNYKVFAWEDAPSGAYLDPDFVRLYEDWGQTVEIQQRGQAQVQVRLIPAGS